LAVVQTTDLPDGTTCRFLGAGFQQVSPSRKSLALLSIVSESRQVEVLDVESFAAKAKWTDKAVFRGISDHWITGYCGKPQDLCLRGIDTSWQPYSLGESSAGVQGAQRMRKSSYFVGDEKLVVEIGSEMSIATVQGKILFTARLPKGRFYAAVASRGGDRFAVVENELRGLRSQPLDMYPFQSNKRVLVFSVSEQRAIYAVGVKGTSPWSPWAIHANQTAISPDGTILALFRDTTLRLFRLPH
jgi:hypothetical protein